MTRRIALLAAVAAVATGCVTAKQKDYAKFVAAQPRSILVVPVMNKSVSLTASDYFLSTIPIPLAERGYYVFPVNLVKRLLEDEGLADPGLVHSADTTRLASMFGADAVLYITIERWEAKYILVQTNVTVAFSYALKDGKTGDTLWEDAQTMVYASGDGGGGLLGAIVSAAITKAAPDYMPLARQANANAMRYPGPGFPAGPYRPEEYRKDVQVNLPPQDASGAPTKQPAAY
jgi:hypothetical protein